MGFGDKGLGFRFEQRVTMPSTPAALDPPLTEREKGRWGGQREENTGREREVERDDEREMGRETESVRDGETETETERTIARERQQVKGSRCAGERSSSADHLLSRQG